MLRVFGIPHCDTVKAACQWLEQHGVAFEFHDLRKDHIDSNTVLTSLTTGQPYSPMQYLQGRYVNTGVKQTAQFGEATDPLGLSGHLFDLGPFAGTHHIERHQHGWLTC